MGMSTEAGPSRARASGPVLVQSARAVARLTAPASLLPQRQLSMSHRSHAEHIRQAPASRRVIDRAGRDMNAAAHAAADGQHIKGGLNKSLWQSYTSLTPSTRIKLAAGLAAFALVGLYVSDQVEPYLPSDDSAEQRPSRAPEPQPAARVQPAEMKY